MARSTLVATTLLLSALILALTPAKQAEASGNWHWACDSQPVTSFWEADLGLNTLTGHGSLCYTQDTLWSSLRVKGLTAGNAYTVWWVYIDDPESCVNFPLQPNGTPEGVPFPEPEGYAGKCGLADFFTFNQAEGILDPLAVFGRMDSVVAEDNRWTRRYGTHFSGELRGLSPSPGSQVWMFVFGHGPADYSDKRQLARQMLTPEDPLSGVPHVGIEGRRYGYPAAVSVINIPE